jgi:hypothetical protein
MTTDTHGTGHKGWIGVDLDGTLAVYHGWIAASHIGEPIAPMANRVLAWLAEGKDVRIFTARVTPGKIDRAECIKAIDQWCEDVFGQTLPITHEKDTGMLELWDDRAVQVIPNTGRRADSLLAHIATLLEMIGNHILLIVLPRNSKWAQWIRCRYNMHDYYDWAHGQPQHMIKEPCVRCGTRFSI